MARFPPQAADVGYGDAAPAMPAAERRDGAARLGEIKEEERVAAGGETRAGDIRQGGLPRPGAAIDDDGIQGFQRTPRSACTRQEALAPRLRRGDGGYTG